MNDLDSPFRLPLKQQLKEIKSAKTQGLIGGIGASACFILSSSVVHDHPSVSMLLTAAEILLACYGVLNYTYLYVYSPIDAKDSQEGDDSQII